MALIPTNLLLQVSPLPATFVGDPNALLRAFVERCRIVSPSGTNFIFIGEAEPSSNVGPWLRGKSWYVWDETIKRYTPLDISPSETIWFQVGATVPTTSTPPIWLRTTANATQASPSTGTPLGWYMFDGTNWVPFVGVTPAGPTSARPSGALDYQLFYDTDISTMLIFERGQWRTQSGVPGDVKFVAFATLASALANNPGWSLLGDSNQSFRGRLLVGAAADSGGANPLTVDSGVPVRQAFEVFGQTDGVKIDNTSPVPYPPQLALYTLVKG